MRILIADDETLSRVLLESALTESGYDVLTTTSGSEALQALTVEDPPRIAILDWLMPDLDGIEVIRQLRETSTGRSIYTILLTGKALKEGLLSAFEAGADDYLLKPFDQDELRARLKAGNRILNLQGELTGKILDLEAALASVRQLEELLPMCSYCRNVRSQDDKTYWSKLEDYLSQRIGTKVSHSICPACYEEHVEPQLARLKKSQVTSGEYGLIEEQPGASAA